jgi:hypothetical protein
VGNLAHADRPNLTWRRGNLGKSAAAAIANEAIVIKDSEAANHVGETVVKATPEEHSDGLSRELQRSAETNGQVTLDR